MKNDTKAEVSVFAPMKGTALAYIITAIVFIIYALLLTYTDISEKNTAAVVLVTLALSLAVGGCKAAVQTGRRGLLYGMATGFLYVLIMVCMGMFFLPGYSIGSKTVVCLLLAVSSGGLGGIIGVNISRRR